MSRPIEFRARALVNDKYNGIKKGDFVYGSFVESGCDAPCIIFGDGEQIEIDRETLGQYTGLTDKNGKKIFEGDILESPDFVEGSLSIVLFNDRGQFVSADPKYHEDFCLLDDYCFIVCGNIYQNPELLNANSNT